ncbi:MAG: hypothetical protein ACLQM6_02560 [Acidobacteriaceae bacterium]
MKTKTGRADQIAQTMVLAVLFAVPALMGVHAAMVNDPDIWWHLRTGEWILNHHSVPRIDPYSSALAGSPWLAYSWLFELVAVKLFHWLGLIGLVVYTSAMILAITVALYHLLRRLQVDFTLVVLLTFAACYSMGRLYSPRPWLLTVLFFVLELDILMQARKTGRARELLWLPVIFALWANVHIQFIDGLVVLGLAWVETLAARWGSSATTRVRPAWMGLALAGSLLATLVNPFGWRIYRAAYELATQAGALNKISELQALPFRTAADYVVLLLALASAAALAWHRRLLLFETALLGFAAVLAFRSQRDVWLMAVVGVVILSSLVAGSQRAAIRLPRLGTAIALLAAGLTMLTGFRLMHVNNARLATDLSRSMPVHAVEEVRARGYAGPLYNDYNWGGYLIWALRMPVSIDGRAAFYGDQRMDRSMATWNAEPDWSSDAQLTSARLVIGPVKSALVQVLRMDPRFQLVFEDKVTAVFIARR